MDSTPKTRITLIEKIKDSADAEAWTEFTAIYFPLVFGICRRKGLQHADATDITQEVLCQVANAIGSYRHDQSGATFRGWLYCITRNLTVDFFRRRIKDPLALATAVNDWNQIREPSIEESREFQLEFRKRVFSVVARSVQSQVAANTWAVFWKTEVEGRDIKSTAKALGMTHGAVYVARSRVIAKLRKEVQQRMMETSQFLINSQGSTDDTN